MVSTPDAPERSEAIDGEMDHDVSALDGMADDPAPTLSERYLVIGTGVQAGARARLHVDESVRVGRAPDNHIVLRDLSVGESAIELRPEAMGVVVRILHGPATIGGDIWETGREGQMPYEAGLSLGGVECRVELAEPVTSVPGRARAAVGQQDGVPAGTIAVAAAQASDDQAPGQSSTFFDPDRLLQGGLGAPDAASALTANAAPSGASPWYRRSGTMFAVLVLLGGIFLGIRGAMTPPAVERVSLKTMLGATPFAVLDITEPANGQWQISGFLETVDEAAELDRLLGRGGYVVDNRVRVAEQISTQVSDIFRVNDIAADVSVADDGAVTVQTRTADEARLGRVEEQVLEDVPGIAGLTIDNQAPPIADEPAPLGPMDPGKRVAMVVSDDPAHIITEDQSRYFVGALLPSGHRVASIDQGRVMLEKMGVETVLDF